MVGDDRGHHRENCQDAQRGDTGSQGASYAAGLPFVLAIELILLHAVERGGDRPGGVTETVVALITVGSQTGWGPDITPERLVVEESFCYVAQLTALPGQLPVATAYLFDPYEPIEREETGHPDNSDGGGATACPDLPSSPR